MDIQKQLLDHDRNKYIKFDEEAHKYWYYPSGDFRKSSEAVEFDGITSWIAQYSQKFDAVTQSKSSAKNPNSKWYGMEPEEIREAWKEKGKESRDYGDQIHKSIENVVNEGIYDENMSFYIDSFLEEMERIGVEPFAAEHVIYDEDIKKATPIDLSGTKKKEFVPMDIKTFKDGMEFFPYKGKNMLAPLSELYDSKYTKVCLQVSIERLFLLKKYNLESQRGYVILLNDDGCRAIPLLDYTDRVKKMYEWLDVN